MKTFIFTILTFFLVLFFQAEARRECPNVCISRRIARRQCRHRRQSCELVRCGRRKRACVDKLDPLESPSSSPPTDPAVTPFFSATSSPSSSLLVSPTSSVTPNPSQIPLVSPSSSISPTPSSSPSVTSTPSVSTTPSVSSSPSLIPSTSSTPSVTPSVTPSPSPIPDTNILSDVKGVSCPSGMSPGPFGGDSCDLTSLRILLAVGPSVHHGFPPKVNCPNRPGAGAGTAGCTICGDETSNTIRELLVRVFNDDAGCSLGIDLIRRIGEYLEAAAVADGVDLCPRNFEVDDGGSYITETLASKFPDIVNAAFCIPDAGSLNVLSDVRGVSCPPGRSLGPFGGESCDLTSLRILLAVGPSGQFGFPPKVNCPNRPGAGGGTAGCTICGDETSNTIRELFVRVFNDDAGCNLGVDLIRSLYESIEATVNADGVDLCPRDFQNDNSDLYISLTFASKFQDVLNDAFCV